MNLIVVGNVQVSAQRTNAPNKAAGLSVGFHIQFPFCVDPESIAGHLAARCGQGGGPGVTVAAERSLGRCSISTLAEIHDGTDGPLIFQ